MKKYLPLFLIPVFAFALCYIAGSVSQATFNVPGWNLDARNWVAAGWIGITLFCIYVYFIFADITK